MTRKNPLKQLKPSTRITLIVNGFTVSCKVQDIRTQAGMECVEAINRDLAAGHKFTGYGSIFQGHMIQMDWS